MRYTQGGGPTAERRQFREQIRFETGERFARGERNAVIAKDLRVSERSVERWRRSWQSPARRALERDEHAVELSKKDVWPQVE